MPIRADQVERTESKALGVFDVWNVS
jgi:hypothetical protein